MEMINSYLEKVKKVNGVYILQVDDDCTDEMRHHILEAWADSDQEESPLMIMPLECRLTYNDRFSFYVALMLVRGGRKVTRDKWLKEARTYDPEAKREDAQYLVLDSDGRVISRKNDWNVKVAYLLSADDMDSDDYYLADQ